ncbi:hypothetical protein C4D60_Mb06t14080 [Musa balbisiana]|uniref:Wall-associated receptor kinase galacturonan-binding domain-containing protein n=1 Tax=Musa balbisiana TaxID=52838 RepID=A0A4V4H3W7_MUSBA|nr:hypothetical protein C4D60_Mb06t14080 [Musa balbisiana]
MDFLAPLLIAVIVFLSIDTHSLAQSSLCRTSCGAIPIRYPLGIDDGCGSPYYRNMLICANASRLFLRTPSGTYPVDAVDYTDPHLVVNDPSMWSCRSSGADDPVLRRAANPFSLDTSTRFSLSSKNDYLFFNCSGESVIVEPKPAFCERFPDRCDSACDSAAYLCRNPPECPDALADRRTSCCSYYPKASESLRLLLQHCSTYASVYWRTVGANFPPYDQVPEYGIRVDFEIPVTTRCLQCEDVRRGGGTCGFETQSRSFLCLCDEGNATTYCTDGTYGGHRASAAVIAGTATVSVAGAVGIGALVWYLRKIRKNSVVTCGVQSNENRLF